MPRVLTKRQLLNFALITSLLLPTLLFAQVTQKTIQVPMRDGLKLETDLYFPGEVEKPLPCILLRTPYSRDHNKEAYSKMAEMGYVIAIQSLRSHTHPEQYPEPYLQDAWGSLRDSYDAIEHLASSEHTNGIVGTFGPSAMGIVQLLAAPTQPPHLKCQFIQVATPSLYHHAAYVGGKLCKHQIESWFAKFAPLAYQHMLEHKQYDAYWEQIDATLKTEDVQVPALHYGGWYDIFSQGTIHSFCSLQENGGEGAKGRQRLVMGPWTHWGMRPETFGEFPYPQNLMSFSEQQCIQSWFDFHLKGDTTALSEEQAVFYYTMGPLDGSFSKGNRWQTAKMWPPKSNLTPYYLTHGKKLTKQMPRFSRREFVYLYDKDNPVPTRGGRNLYLESGPYKQNENEARKDVLVFTTEVLDQDVEVTGHLKAKVFISSSMPTTDVAISLTDVYPDGTSVLIAEGIQEVSLEKNKIQPVEVDLWSTSMVFAKGHRIRVNLAASNYPHFDKNEHSSNNVLHVGQKYPSHILLPEIHP